MAILINHNKTPAAGAGGSTSTGLDTTGADFLIMIVAWFSPGSGGSALTIADSKIGNTWHPLTSRASGSVSEGIFWCVPVSVGTGHTFSATGTAVFASQMVLAFNIGGIASPFDIENGAAANTSSLATGSTGTPAQDNELIISGFGFNQTTVSASVDNSLLQADPLNQFVAAVSFGTAAGYLFQGTKSAINPIWTRIGSSDMAVSVAAFKTATLPATKLIIASAPSVAITQRILTNIVVNVEASDNSIVTGDTGNVTISINVSQGIAILSGTTTKAAVAGIATFNDLQVLCSDGDVFTLIASRGGLISGTTPNITGSVKSTNNNCICS